MKWPCDTTIEAQKSHLCRENGNFIDDTAYRLSLEHCFSSKFAGLKGKIYVKSFKKQARGKTTNNKQTPAPPIMFVVQATKN